MPTIKFLCEEHLKGVVAEPYKASTALPKWYKDLQGNIPHEPGNFPVGTAKKCIPLLDAMGAGYIIPIPIQVHVLANAPQEIEINWSPNADYTLISGHSQQQAPGLTQNEIMKWHNPWSIRTPAGYSCLFVAPINNPDMPFECFTGVVDTDTYHNRINFPFQWLKYPFDKVLDQGYPMVQVVPFKRQEWGMEVKALTKAQSAEVAKSAKRVGAKKNQYKSEAHHKKEW